MRAEFAVPVPKVQNIYDRQMASRHYGGTVNRLTATTVKKDKVQANNGSQIDKGLKPLNQIMLS